MSEAKQPIVVGTITLQEIEDDAAYTIREGIRYEAYPGGYLTLRKPTIALGRKVDAAAQEIGAGVSAYDNLISQVKLAAEAPDGFDWNHEELDAAVLRRIVDDFFRRSLGFTSRPGKSLAE